MGGRAGPGSPPPLMMLIGTQTLSEAAAETGGRGSEVTKWDVNKSVSLSPHKAAVSHSRTLGKGHIGALGTVTACSLSVAPSFFT